MHRLRTMPCCAGGVFSLFGGCVVVGAAGLMLLGPALGVSSKFPFLADWCHARGWLEGVCLKDTFHGVSPCASGLFVGAPACGLRCSCSS